MANSVPIERQIGQAVKCLTMEGKLIGYEDELRLVVSAILANDCGFNCNLSISSSYLSQTPHNADNRPLMQIGMLNRKKPLDIIWSILHEYGHLLQGSAALKEVEKDNSLEYPREKDAWDKAAEEALKYPRLAAMISDFYAYRDFALSTYKR